MSSTVFIDYSATTPIVASWLNDVNAEIYNKKYPDGTHSQTAEGLAASTGSSLVGFTQPGTGAIARTLQDKMRESVSVKDFGADPTGVVDSTAAFSAAGSINGTGAIEVVVPRGNFLLNANPSPTGKVTWILDAATVLSGVGGLSSAVINKGALTNNWIKSVSSGIYSYLDDNAALKVQSNPSAIGGFSAVRSSTGGGSAGEANIGLATFAYNDHTTGSTGVWGLYSTVLRNSTVNGPTHGMEIDVANIGATIPLYPNAIFSPGQNEGIWLCTGGETTNNSPVGTASCALAIVQNDSQTTKTAKFDKGIIFHSQAISGTDGSTGFGIAIALSKNHDISWFNSINQIVGRIRSAGSNSALGQSVTFSDYGLLIEDITSGNALFQVQPVSNPVNRVVVTPSPVGAPVQISSNGVDTDVDILFSPRGAGVLRFGILTTNADAPITGYITIKDSTGVTRKLAVIS
jgi:hypothetical protein